MNGGEIMEVLTETIKFNRNINPQVGFQFQPTMKYYSNDYLFIADNIKNFYRPTRPGFKKVECWLKIAYFIIQWYITNANKNKEFYMSTRAIKKRINEDFNNQYATRTIQKGIKTCSDLGLIEIEYSKEKKSEMANPNEYINRKIKLNYKKVNELLAVYDIDEDPLYKSLPKRNRLKKFIKKRPIAYVKAVEAKYKEYETGGRKAYTNSTEMVSSFVYKITTKFVGINRTIRKHIPNCLVNKERTLEDAINQKRESRYGTLSYEDLMYFKKVKSSLTINELENLINDQVGWFVPIELREEYESLGFTISSNGTITGYSDAQIKKNVDVYGGFDIL